MDIQNQAMNLVLSADAKPRLKWTPELHQRFVEAVNQLGGPEKATPKSLMRVIGIPGLTLYHLKSHLQKFRLGKSQHAETCSDNTQEDCRDSQSNGSNCSREINGVINNQMNESLHIAEALQMQLEVQRKFHEQIEVQKRLQLRIEAQGKYLQSVLKKAQETLAQYNSSTVGIETAKIELSRLISIISNAYPTSPISEITETRVMNFKELKRKDAEGTICSLESSLTSSESSGRDDEKHPMIHGGDHQVTYRASVVELQLMAIHSQELEVNGNESSEGRGRKRNGVTSSADGSTEQPFVKSSGNKSRRLELSKMLDLNSQYHSDLDLN